MRGRVTRGTARRDADAHAFCVAGRHPTGVLCAGADIDHWKIDEWKPEYMSAPLLEESSFATLFPRCAVRDAHTHSYMGAHSTYANRFASAGTERST